jgi:hypothetical protein
MKKIDEPHILVDLDGTLAFYESWTSAYDIGEPIKPMVQKVKRLLKEGKKVKIFTARVSEVGPYGQRSKHEMDKTKGAIKEWCKKHLGQELEITNVKTFHTVQIFDDRCVQIIPNSGLSVSEYMLGLTMAHDLPTPSPKEKGDKTES